jgi:hypothetical protein
MTPHAHTFGRRNIGAHWLEQRSGRYVDYVNAFSSTCWHHCSRREYPKHCQWCPCSCIPYWKRNHSAIECWKGHGNEEGFGLSVARERTLSHSSNYEDQGKRSKEKKEESSNP